MRYELWAAVLHGHHSPLDGNLRDGAGGLDERPAQLDRSVALQARVPVAEPYPHVDIDGNAGPFRVTYPDRPSRALFFADADIDPERVSVADLAGAHRFTLRDSLGYPLFDTLGFAESAAERYFLDHPTVHREHFPAVDQPAPWHLAGD